MLALHVLASGSKGNAAIIENLDNGEGVLVDCGICKRDFMNRSLEANFDISKLKAILITHDHSDHVKGLGVVTRGLREVDYELYALSAVARGSKQVLEASKLANLNEISFGDTFRTAGMVIDVFETSHDAIASCGFRFESGDHDSIGFITDTGYVTEAAKDVLSGVRILAIESNHDAEMLEGGEYPYYLKSRIASDRGHLSNNQACEAVRLLHHEGLDHVVAMHISQNNNLPSIVKESLGGTLAELSNTTTLHLSSQTRLVSVR